MRPVRSFAARVTVDDDEGPAPLLDVAFDVQCELLAATMDTEVGKRPLGPTETDRQLKKWVNEIEKVARQVHPQARVVIQPDVRMDHFGLFGSRYAIIWCRPDVDVEAMRARLYEGGQHVGVVTLHYNPAVA